MMRSHGADIGREIYNFGEPGEPIYDAIEETIHLRYSLLPYIYSTSSDITFRNGSFMRALAMDFKNDQKTWTINNEFMFGKSILVAPILNAHYTPEENKILAQDKELISNSLNFKAKKSTNVYLPLETGWYDYFTNVYYKGGQTITKETTINTIPLFIKAGTILPIAEKMQYATEKRWDNLDLKIYEGADAEFTLYEDEFDNYNYEKGAYTEIVMKWNDSKKTLTIHDIKGEYKGMLKERKFNIIKTDGTRKTIQYLNKKMVVKL